MKKNIIAALIIVASSSLALAQGTQDPKDLAGKVMKDLPGTKGGTTDMPTAKPDDSLAGKVMKDLPGTKGGSTDMPTAKPDSGTLSDIPKNEQDKTKL